MHTKIAHCYTLEANYNTGKSINMKSPPQERYASSGRASPGVQATVTPPRYTPYEWEETGRGCAVALLDLESTNPWSRLPASRFKRGTPEVRKWNVINHCHVSRPQRVFSTD